MSFLLPFIPFILAAHIVCFTAWMAAMFYLPRLYVYHCQTEIGSAESARFKIMERRLLRQIANPAMIATWFFGLLLILAGLADWHAAWWWIKFIAVILMSGFHGASSKWRKNFANDANTKSEKFYRIANEIPTVLFIIIVFSVVA
jgi:putative membrane protein